MAPIETAEDLLAAARERGLRLAAEDPELDATGADFLVLHATDEHGVRWVVRTPRRADVLERASAERKALELVGSRLPVAVPDWHIFSPEVIAYPRLGGDPAAVVDLSAGGYCLCDSRSRSATSGQRGWIVRARCSAPDG